MYVQPSRSLPGTVKCPVIQVTVVPGMVPKSWPHSLLKEDSEKPSPERGVSWQVPEAVKKDVSFVGGTLGWMDLEAGAVAETSALFGPHLIVSTSTPPTWRSCLSHKPSQSQPKWKETLILIWTDFVHNHVWQLETVASWSFMFNFSLFSGYLLVLTGKCGVSGLTGTSWHSRCERREPPLARFWSASLGFFLRHPIWYTSLVFLGLLGCKRSNVTGVAMCFHFNQEILLETLPKFFLFPSCLSKYLTRGGWEVKIKTNWRLQSY